jgi:hypothetical protein
MLAARIVNPLGATSGREAGDRPINRLADFADRGGLPVHGATGPPHDRRSTDPEAGITELHRHATARDAFPGDLAERRDRQPRQMAG